MVRQRLTCLNFCVPPSLRRQSVDQVYHVAEHNDSVVCGQRVGGGGVDVVCNQPAVPLVAPQGHRVQLTLVQVAAARVKVAKDDLVLAAKRLPGPDRYVGQCPDLGQGVAWLGMDADEDNVGLTRVAAVLRNAMGLELCGEGLPLEDIVGVVVGLAPDEGEPLFSV